MKIYTRKGDDGTTGLLGGTRVSKTHLRINAYGTVDELNAHIGLIADQQTNKERAQLLRKIQERLFTIGALLAIEKEPGKSKVELPGLKEDDIQVLEKAIDKMNEVLPPMKNFILPGGHPNISYCHIARCVCRRAEREVIALHEQDPVDPLVKKYLNRLSDYLFVLSRKTGQELTIEELVWKPDKE